MQHKYLFTLFLLIILLVPSFASDWTNLYILTDKILVLRFNDGYIQHNGYRQAQNQTLTFKFPLNIDLATNISSYTVTSSDDPDFATGIQPLRVSRKTKGRDYSNNCNWVNSICDNDYINEHFIYLELPIKLKKGKTYVVEIAELAENYTVDTLYVDFTKIRSLAVHANQIGFKPNAPVKYAYLSHWMGDGGPLALDEYHGNKFNLIDQQTGQSVYQGIISKRLDIASATQLDLTRTPEQGYLSMSDVWECDFSEFSIPGEYVISVEGIGTSFPFKIDQDIYREAYYHATRQLYHQRSGIALEKLFTEWTRPRNLHPEDKKIRFQYTTSRWLDWPNNAAENGVKADVYAKVLADYKIDTWGWYMDAGDWDGYYNHLKIPRLLMTAFELAPQNFIDGELNIPESGNGIPDILDEARWLIDYFDRTRGPSGGIAGARIHPDFETKAVDNIPSWEDERIWTISGEDHVTTYTFAGLSAHLAQLYYSINKNDLADELKTKSQQAYEWARTNSNPAINDSHNARLYAAASLYKLTGDEKYQDDFAYDFVRTTNARYALDNFHFALWMYLTTNRTTIDASLRNNALAQAIQYVDNEFIDTAEKRSFRVGFGWNFRTFLGQATTPLVFPALVMYHVTGDKKYYRAALTSCDYVLGGNPADMSWMVGLGDQTPEQILHLDTWLHPDSRTTFIPGTIPYGPTSPGDGWTPNNGPWSSDFAWNRIYPEKSHWPLHEGFFNNRYAVPTNEYTVHQTSAPAAAVYGLLSGAASGNFIPNKAPTLVLTVPGSLVAGEDAALAVDVHDEDGYVIRVEYYNGWRKIGESRQEPFSFVWKNIPEGPYEIKAIAIDNEGKRSVTYVLSNVVLEEIRTTTSTIELTIGEKKQIEIELLPENATIKNVVWEVNDISIATIDQKGMVTALAEGETRVTVRALDADVKTEINLKVNAPITSIEKEVAEYNLYPNPIVSGILHIELPDSLPTIQYRLSDMNGRQVAQGYLHKENKTHSLDTGNLSEGLYMLILESSNKIYRFKVVAE